MKKFQLSIIVFLIASVLFAQQVPESVNYQTIIKNTNGQYVSNESVSLQLNLVKDSPSGIIIYSEMHVAQTNDYGLINLKIGEGLSNDVFGDIDWSSGQFFLALKVSIGNTGVYEDMGAFPFSSVPYALYAKDANVQLEEGEGITVDNKQVSAKTTSPLWNANALQNKPVEASEPAIGDVLVYDGSNWVPSQQNTVPVGTGVLSFEAEAPNGYDFSGNTIVTKKKSGEWTSVAPMNIKRRYVAACEYEGKLYAFGGEEQGDFTTDHVEVYDPVLNQWSTRAAMPFERVHASVISSNGFIYMAGGFEDNSHFGTTRVDVYNPIDQVWSSISPMNTGRWGNNIFAYNNKLYAAGGQDALSNSNFVNSIEEYDFTTDSWTTIFTLPQLHIGTKMAMLDGIIYFVYSSQEDNGLNTYSYNINTKEWKTHPPLNTTRLDFALGTIGGHLVVTGGIYNGEHINSTELFSTESNSWISIVGDLTEGAYGLRGAEVDGKFIVAGGVDVDGLKTNVTQVLTLSDIEEVIYLHLSQ
ncbi:kelch repeat-containing protein [Carboxylicivirga sp. M1479]|uniref:Kelch repeat-containing protein n=1 Tax=Carboxylicivirga sp. M1479 TaxID=2594476 RepID=UPI001177561D|nr:kelch repeat-containing protein [Carboxylicivirga sp. M1479]TRX71720.1 hypothetical protein FNN09_05635 [Carboxylicivirga sp. M1479]